MTTTVRPADLPDLPADLCGGGVHRPGDAGYDAARQAWSLNADLRPYAVAYPSSTAELVEVVKAARHFGLRIAAESTGHAAGTIAAEDLSDTVLVKTSGMSRVSVDPERKIVRAEAGAIWEDVVRAVAAHGLTVLHGSSPDVGIAGYTLGGGLGWYARELGLAAHSLIGATVVTSSGELIEVSDDLHPDLMWALRGGAGGNFAVVAEFEFRAFDFTQAYAGHLIWDISRGAEVLRAWARWSATAPDCVTTSFRFLRLPDIPEIPEPFRGGQFAMIDGAVLGRERYATEAEADAAVKAVIAPLRALSPRMDDFEWVPTSALPRLHMDPEGPTPAVMDTAMLASLGDDAIDAFLAAAGPGVETPVLAAEIRQLGGRLARPSDLPSALSGFASPYALFAVAMTPLPQLIAPFQAACSGLVAAMRPWRGGYYLNFAEHRVDAAQAFPAETWNRLRALRFVWDPDEALIASHPIPPRLPKDLI